MMSVANRKKGSPLEGTESQARRGGKEATGDYEPGKGPEGRNHSKPR